MRKYLRPSEGVAWPGMGAAGIKSAQSTVLK
jgi:hypothetical protein